MEMQEEYVPGFPEVNCEEEETAEKKEEPSAPLSEESSHVSPEEGIEHSHTHKPQHTLHDYAGVWMSRRLMLSHKFPSNIPVPHCAYYT